ncbi:glycoside hydrolase family 97 protein [Bacteroidota bacterium]
MKIKTSVVFGISILLTIYSCSINKTDNLSVLSPNKQIKVTFELDNGVPYYSVSKNGNSVITKSKLGFQLKDAYPHLNSFQIIDNSKDSYDNTWEQLWGEKQFIRNNYNKLFVNLEENNDLKRQLNIIFKVFDDGIGFRYEIPQQNNLDSVIILDEVTEFALSDNHDAWWIPAYRDNRYEYLYKKSKINELDTVHTPLTIETTEGIYICIHEANLTNYASMTLANIGDNVLKCDLVPWADGIKVKSKAPMVTPWRTIQIADEPGDLITSYLILNLNEPNILEDVSWIKPIKYMGIWWGMHIGKYTFFEGEKHGASTENAKYYIDFASENNITDLLIEGWNKGWTPEWYLNKLHYFSFTDQTDDFDIEEVNRYAKSKDVNIIGYHETGSNINNYLKQIDDGMKIYKDLGMHSIKIGQVGSRLNMKEWHHGQYGVEYYRYVLEKAADYELTVNFHEPIKPTGLRRTLPNLMAGEGARGQEYNAWSEGNPPEHLVILPFTRLLAGPMDFTPGIFSIEPTRVHTTVAKQLAIYIAIYSPVQMLADLPENYKGHPEFKFLLDVPVDWEDTKVLNAKIGEYLTIVRKDKNSDDWYLGSLTNEEERKFEITLDFLENDKKYVAEIYADAKDAHWDKNPEATELSKLDVDFKTSLTIKLAPGGGQAIRFQSITE